MGTLSFHGSSATIAYTSTFLWPRLLGSFPQLQLQAQRLDTKVLEVAHNLCRKGTENTKVFLREGTCMYVQANTHLWEQTYVYLTLLWSLSNEVHFLGDHVGHERNRCGVKPLTRPEESAVVDRDTQHQSTDEGTTQYWDMHAHLLMKTSSLTGKGVHLT